MIVGCYFGLLQEDIIHKIVGAVHLFYKLNREEQDLYSNELLGEADAESNVASDSDDDNWCPVPRATRQSQNMESSDSENTDENRKFEHCYVIIFILLLSLYSYSIICNRAK